jgi:hypothetical protein
VKTKSLQYQKNMLVFLFLLFTLVTSAQDPKGVASISIAPDVSGLSVGDVVHVPVRITTATSPNVPVASAIFFIDYDQNVLVPLGPYGFTISYLGIYMYNPYYATNRLYLSFETADNSNKNFANTKLVTLDFIFLGGNTAMHLRRPPDVGNLCGFFNNLGSSIPIGAYTDNTISGNPPGTYYDLHSISTGGPFDWFDAASWEEGKTPSVAANVFITGDEVQIFYNEPPFSETPRCHNLTIYPGGLLTLNPDYSLFIGGNLDIQNTPSGQYPIRYLPVNKTTSR